jgi:hypothetical protein
MVAKVQGTVVFDGLVEGRIPELPGAEAKLRSWAQDAQTESLRWSLEIDGAHFSVLAGNQPVAVAKLGGRVDQAVTDALADLLKTFPPAERTQVFSTLRSTEFRKQEEVQTLYAVGGDGRVVIEQRKMTADTIEPEAPLSRRERGMRVAMAAALVIGLLGLSTLVVDYPKLYRSLRGARLPAAGLAVENVGFADYFTITKTALSGDRVALVLSLERTRAFPLDDVGVDSAATQAATRSATQPGSAIRTQMVIEALARGWVHVEMYDDKGKFLGEESLRIGALRSQNAVDMELRLPVISGEVQVPARIVLGG